jgi:iron complex transport system permease protein
MNKRLVVLALILMFSVLALATVLGSTNIPIGSIVSVLWAKMSGQDLPAHITAVEASIIWIIRFPRVLLAFLVGASLAVGGSTTQSVLRNPLASPYTLGVSAGASLGVVMAMLLDIRIPFLGYFSYTMIGFLSGLVTVLLVLSFAMKVDKNMSNQTIVLAGIVFSLFVNAIITLATALAQEDLQMIIRWQMGSLSLKSWSYIISMLPFFLVGLAGTIYYARELDALSFGEENALVLGVEVAKIKHRLIVFSAVLTGSAVAVSGTIGFIGLVAPHVVRRIFGPKHRLLLPMSAVFGGMLLVVTDLVARTVIAPTELPVGAITALIGAPFFAFIYFTKSRGN